MRIKSYLIILLMLLAFVGCNWNRNRLDIDVSGIRIPETRIHRYDKDLFAIPPGELQSGLRKLEPEYRYFLGNETGNPEKLARMKDYLESPRNLEFYKACEKKYPDLSLIEKGLNDAFRHYKYYFTEAVIPGVYTYISGGDYENPVEISDTVMIIALDTYLGRDFKPYEQDGVPLYRAVHMTERQIVPDCISALVFNLYPADPSVMTLLGQIIEAGKRLYLLDALLPRMPDSLKIGYTPSQVEWITKYETQVWGAIIENRMLYSAKSEITRMFLADGPFTTEFSQESPPRLGEWIGWHIVRDYMNRNTTVTLKQLMTNKDFQGILAQSGYKPGK